MAHAHAHAPHTHGPVIGKHAPNFSADAVVNGDFKTVSLHDYKGKWLVLFFYPLGTLYEIFPKFPVLRCRIARFHFRLPH